MFALSIATLLFFQATLERDGALAGHEVKADVLRMEIGALEGELRRARQELGASEAGRREVRHGLVSVGGARFCVKTESR